MAQGNRTVKPGQRNKELSSTFQPPEEGRRVQRPKPCDKLGDKDEDNSPKNVNNVHNTSSQKYRWIITHTRAHTHTHIHIYIYIYIYEGYSMKGFFENSKMNYFQNFFSINVNCAWFEICLKQKLLSFYWNISFESIQNGSKLNRVLQAWTEVCHEIFGDLEVKSMWNFLKNM